MLRCIRSCSAQPSLLWAYLYLASHELCRRAGTLAADETRCADQIQRCGVLVEELERQIQESKAVAFKGCVIRTPCIQERIAFDDCFARSLRSVRTPLQQSDNFSSTANAYRVRLEGCFSQPPTTPSGISAQSFIDGNSIYTKAIYSPEFADQLWGLTQNAETTAATKASLNLEGVCLLKDSTTRIFGGGTTHLIDHANSSQQRESQDFACALSSEELTCYRRTLEADSRLQQILQNRYSALRSCVQNVRLQSECRRVDVGQLRQCVCDARESLEESMLRELLDCVKHSPVARLYTALVDMSSGTVPDVNLTDSTIRLKQRSNVTPAIDTDQPSLSYQHADEPSFVASSAGSTITQGTILNGQCLCACARDYSAHQRPATTTRRDPLVAASTDYLNPRPVVYTNQQTQPLPRNYYQSYSYNPATRAQATAYSTEGGIMDGLESFFNGQPPPL